MLHYLAGVLLAIVSSVVPPVKTPLHGKSSIQWKECPAALAAPSSKVKCGTLAVPLDWDNPRKGSIHIGVARLPARKPEVGSPPYYFPCLMLTLAQNRIGNLLYQPGGPGNPGTNKVVQVETGATRWGDDLLDNFDLIGVGMCCFGSSCYE